MSIFSFSRNHYCTLGLVVLYSCLSINPSWSQDRERRRDRTGRFDDPTSLLTVYQDPKTAPLLNLSKEQEEKLGAFRIEGRRASRKLSRDEQLQTKKELELKAVNVLDNDQRAAWRVRKEEIVAEQSRLIAQSRLMADASGTGDAGTESSTPVPRGTIPTEKVPEGAITVISFGKDTSAKAAASNPKTDTTDKKNNSPNEEATLEFEFQYAPWVDVLKLFADLNGLSLDLNDIPPGTFNYYDNKKHTMTEAMDVINGYLLGHGYALVRRDRFLVCLNIVDNPIPPNVIPSVTQEELEKRGKNELLSMTIKLDGLDPEKIAPDVKELLGPHGSAVPLKNSNSLVLMGTGGNLRRVSQLLNSGNPLYSRDTAFKAIPLKHVSADFAEQKVRRLFSLNQTTTSSPQPAFGGGGGGGGRGGFGGGGGWQGRGGGGNPGGGGGGGGGDQAGQGGGGQPPAAPAPAAANPNSSASPYAGKIQVTADSHTKHLLVIAKGEYLKLVEDVVLALDRDTDANGNRVDMTVNPTYMETYSVAGSDTAAISRMISNMGVGSVVGDDPRGQKIFIQGTKDEHEQIRKLLSKNSGASSEVIVVELLTLDPSWVMNKLTSLYSSDSTRAPSIVADPAGRRIVIRGTAEQLTQVKTILRDMGESSISLSLEDNGNSAEKRDRGTSRRLNLGNRDADLILKLVQQTWDASGRSPIRIVDLPKPSPIKDRRVPGSSPLMSDPNANDLDQNILPQRESTKSETRKTIEKEPANRSNDPRRDTGKPREERRGRKSRPETTQIYPRRVSVVRAVQPEDEVNGEKDGEVAPENGDLHGEATIDASQNDASPDKPSREQSRDMAISQNEPKTPTAETGNGKETPVGITIMGNNLILTSPDTNALDQLETIIGAFITAMPQRTLWSVRYLRTADASECATMIEKLFPQNSTNTPAPANEPFFNPFGFGRGGMLGQSTTSQNQSQVDSQSLRIVTDTRANALFITGPTDLVRDIDYVLAVLDSNELPGSTRERFPRTIPVEYADVEEVADIIKDVFKDSMTTDQPQQGQQQQQQNQGFNPFAAMMFAGNRPGAGGAAAARKPPIELTLGVDKRTNNLIVSCNETMYRRVESMVQELDRRAKESRPTVRMVELKMADPMIVQSTLASLMPRVTVGATRSNKKDKKPTDAQSPGQPQAPDAQMIQRMTDQYNNQPGGGGRGGGGGGRGNNSGRRGAN